MTGRFSDKSIRGSQLVWLTGQLVNWMIQELVNSCKLLELDNRYKCYFYNYITYTQTDHELGALCQKFTAQLFLNLTLTSTLPPNSTL